MILWRITQEILPNSLEVVIKQNYQDHKLELDERTNLVFPVANNAIASFFEENGGQIRMANTITRKIDNQEITDLELKEIVNGSLDGASQILSEAKIEDRQMTLCEKQKI